ncbi:hypothetical protein Scep_009717 [Stephania cephalantha]|uniref:Uncharacterized protein n=1 Tax=Stephania cephalantha TaxID=152367 RepID=A0AAP0PGI9_9MAGN
MVQNCPTHPPRPKNVVKCASKTDYSVVAAVTYGSPSFPTIPLSEIEALLK